MNNQTDPEVLRAFVREALGEAVLGETDQLVRVLAATAGHLDRIAGSIEDIRAVLDADRREKDRTDKREPPRDLSGTD